jgi:RNA polymerase subunit RPABC4/transcription elongation factor Spt4
MSLVKCKKCKYEYKQYEKNCPNCNSKNEQLQGKILFISFIGLVILISLYYPTGDKNESPLPEHKIMDISTASNIYIESTNPDLSRADCERIANNYRAYNVYQVGVRKPHYTNLSRPEPYCVFNKIEGIDKVMFFDDLFPTTETHQNNK